jgi:putative colanic acid biosynthesis UDP-glucose lipid carrier transferase
MINNYSIFIRPISILAHLLILNLALLWGKLYGDLVFVLNINLLWLFIAYLTRLYKFHRTITITQVVKQLWIQFSIFALTYLAYYAILDRELNFRLSLKIWGIAFGGITLFRALYFYALRRYRIEGGNFKNVILIGSNKALQPLVDFMMSRADFGYKILGFFSNKNDASLNYQATERAFLPNKTGNIPLLGDVKSCESFSLGNAVDEIYCSLSELKEKDIKRIIDFGDQYMIKVKLVPDNKDFITKNLSLEYYGFVPVFAIRNFPLDRPVAKFLKRTFDIVFSLLVIIFILSWLSPILYILIKKESEGPLFFKQVREGIKGNGFMCYKYRTMGVNDRSHLDQTIKNDVRITKIGKFLRKTSIDELPQFINVLKGEMSVVGPRPHMMSQSNKFKKIVDKYMVRHFVKPGITGLAQVRGYRGEIEKDSDIINRVKFDIFYVENWSIVLDVNIILKTILNIFKGEEKAY